MRYRFLFLLFLTVSGCCLRNIAEPDPPTFAKNQCSPDGSPIDIYVVDLGWHTGILLRSDSVSEELRLLIPEFSKHPFVEVGWGDEQFYMSSGCSYWAAFRASFFSHGSALHLAAYDNLAQIGLSNFQIEQIRLSKVGMQRLSMKILGSFERNQTGDPIRLGDSLYGQGSFYKATGEFSITHTCNSWTSEALQAAGCPITPTRRASTLMHQLQTELP